MLKRKYPARRTALDGIVSIDFESTKEMWEHP
jgi:hypothetical protein